MKIYQSICCLLLVGVNFPSTLAIDRKLVNLYLYTPKHRESPEKIKIDSIPSYYMSYAPTIIITHGYKDSYTSESCKLIRDAYLTTRHKPNVIVFDWGYYSNVSDIDAHETLTDLGKFVYDSVTSMQSRVGLFVDQVTLVGHGRGAQILAYVAINSKVQFDTIWGLDVHTISKSGPPFIANLINDGIAKHVNVIHTSIDGIRYNRGTADYYLNGGLYQPGCELKDTRCSYERAYKYFAEAISTDDGFFGHTCPSYSDAINNNCQNPHKQLMSVVKTKNPIYYVKTNMKSPYACGAKHCLNP